MSTIFFFRHGQAGTRDDYDQLSATGREQARLLAAHLSREQMRFTRVLTGPLRRQRETAALVGLTAEVDPAWAEFDLDAVMAEVVPQLMAADADFAARYRQQQSVIESGDPTVHRIWTPVDSEVVKAWIEGRFPTKTESWLEFHLRIEGALNRLRHEPPDALIAVSTSAAPIGISVGMAHGLGPAAELGLAGAMCNTAITVLCATPDNLNLVSFNSVPHLTDPLLRTLR